jgi:hypothetical protein
MKKLLLLTAMACFCQSCATILIPSKQNVVFNTAQDATVYVSNEEIGKGESFSSKIRKNGSTKQVVTVKSGYKDQYSVLVPSRRQPGFWAVQPFNVGWFLIYGFNVDFQAGKNLAYQKVADIKLEHKLPVRTDGQKYINISKVKLDIKNKNKNIVDLYTNYYNGINKDKFDELEQKYLKNQTKQEEREAKKNKKTVSYLDNSHENIKYDDTKYTADLYKLLKNTGYIDTVNIFFADHNNTIYLEGSIEKIYALNVYGKAYSKYLKSKVYLTWYIKNYFDEVLDSIKTYEYSGDFSYEDKTTLEEKVVKMVGDAVDISYLNLHDHPTLLKYMPVESDFSSKDSVLNLPNTKNYITNKAEAGVASVIVKTKNGHGSGFAVTNDGYIITNYHVVAQSQDELTIINSDGIAVKGKLIRYNKYRDIALIKVNMNFPKVFSLTQEKKFHNLQEVFTIGAPKSVELGQTVSTGVISNERNYNNNKLIQLNMAVNSGNSGGPVFDGMGILHGVIVSKAIGKNTEGISFAIPGYLIREYLNIKIK